MSDLATDMISCVIGIGVDAGRMFPHDSLIATVIPVRVSPHDQARRIVMEEALECGAKWLLFVDDDTILPPHALESMLVTAGRTGAAMVSGIYYRREFPYTSIWSKKVGDEWFQVDATHGQHELDTSGLGCALIDVEWVEKNLESPWFEMAKSASGFSMITDDITFCNKIREKDGLIIGDADIRCGHLSRRMIVCRENSEQLRAARIEKDNKNGI